MARTPDGTDGTDKGNGKGSGTAPAAGGRWAGANRRDGKIRVAIVGVGNCASSLVQGRYYYENAKETDFVPGLMHVSLGGYHVRDIEFVAAFDINKTKVGKDLSEAIYAHPNNTIVFQQVPHLGVTVERGMTHDGLGKYLSQIIEKAPGPTADIVGILREREVDVMVSYLPVGSEEATKWYAELALRAGVGFVNAIPVFIGREPYWQRRFAQEGLPVIGDDIKSQVGATISHRVLTRLFMDRGVRLDRTYQLNFGGNTDFLNMLERERLESKKISKTNAVTSMLDYEMDPDNVHVGPSDHVPWLLDRKYCYIVMEGTTFGDVPLKAELKLEVWDSPNSAGVITDAIRCLKLGLDRGLSGTLVAASSYFMKSPPQQLHDDIAHERVEAFIRGEDNTTLVGTEEPSAKTLRTVARPRTKEVATKSSSAPGEPPAPQGAPAAEAPAARGRFDSATAPGPKLADPHRPVSRGPRVREKVVIIGYRAGEWILGRLPMGPAALVGGWASVASYWLWPEKRRIVDANCAQVLGLSRSDPRVGRLARQVYRNQVRWVLELMRMHRLSRPQLVAQVDPAIIEPFEVAWKSSNGMIVAAPHFGNNEAGAAGLAGRGWPLNAVADDSAYEELFNHFVRERRRWGVEIVPWRNLRGVFRVLRRKEIVVLLVDWGYRPDGIPVRFFGEWTTFPAGPAALAAKTGASIVALIVTRGADRIFRVEIGERVFVTSNDPAELQRATQAIADDLEAMIRRAPEQWTVFKPIWPLRPGERAELHRRVVAGDVGGAVNAGAGPASDLPGDDGPAHAR